MNEFTTSNGITLTRDEGGWISGGGLFLGKTSAIAFAEFFRAEEDEHLGRWRWPENPDYVVYPDSWHDVRVLRESDGIGYEFNRSKVETNRKVNCYPSPLERAARAYFDAHPEPKPWHDAKPDEVWVLTGAGGLELPWQRSGSGEWMWLGTSRTIYRANTDLITAGRRIWPEVTA